MSPAWIDSVPPITLADLLNRINELSAKLQNLPERLSRLEQLVDSGCVRCQAKHTPLESFPANVKPTVLPCDGVATVSSEEPVSSSPTEPKAVKLPTKVLQAIFQHLTASQLANARTVCRRWNRIIGTSATLMDRFELNPPTGSKLQADCEPVQSLSSRFTRAYFDGLVIFGAAAWWPRIGASLHTLALIDCHVSVDMVLGMLRQTPALRSFEFQDGDSLFFSDVPEVDFELTALETLDIAIVERVELLDVFAKICPNLKDFIVIVDKKLPNAAGKIVNFVESVQNTLVNFQFDYHLDVWYGLTKLKNLKLKRIASQNKINDNFLQSLVMSQPTIEDIILQSPISNQCLQFVGANLKNLTSLYVPLQVQQDGSAKLSFLDTMPKLDTLTVNGSSDVPVLSIEVGKHSKLDALRLELWQQPATGSNWFRRFPNLRTLELDQCTLASWSDLFVPATQLKKLRNLSLAYVDATDSKEYLSDYLDSLTFMSLQQCEMSKSLLTELISLCPKLEEIHLLEMEIVDDDILMEICQKLTQLATLHVTKSILNLGYMYPWGYHERSQGVRRTNPAMANICPKQNI
ncbi:conserved hypothetical protein [Culex quinquefasciatus]|uniref:F-box domain-containing protein n=1 Tax=Culex quinquefasciatus TaxID=7176 RepID=B0XKL1_CULQU|nr:conserved hypothetical protein [Culex quinquefasciatus]|eukprot:XP_001870183.1 conserved hypothetical protein [Culex quinquefasciatus]